MPRSLPGRFVMAAVVVMTSICFVRAAYVTEYVSGITWDEPKVIQPDPVPSDAIVLFDGKDMAEWSGGENWEVKDGVATAQKNGITSKRSFGDCQLHVEWASPEKIEGNGQGRGNSGLYLMGKYEVQILDSFDNKTYFDGQCGSVYKQRPPMVNACRKPGEWQTYDILFTAPRFDDSGKVTKPAAVTVLQNSVVLHNHFELLGGTFYDRPPAYEKHADKLPINIQFHGNPVRFRNIWIRELADLQFKPKE
jgi:hypothetical protein